MQINTNSMFRQACMGTMLYFVDATVYTGEVMDCKMELENDHDRYAVAVRNKDKKIVGHIRVELSKSFHKFLSQHGQIEAECIDSRFNASQGKRFELPVYYRLVGNARYFRKLITKLQKKQEEEGSDWKISDLRKCDCQDWFTMFWVASSKVFFTEMEIWTVLLKGQEFRVVKLNISCQNVVSVANKECDWQKVTVI